MTRSDVLCLYCFACPGSLRASQAVYLWNASTREVQTLVRLPEGDSVTSVSWTPSGAHLAVGTDSSAIQLWDVAAGAKLRELRSHSARVGALAWNPLHAHCVSSGSRDATIVQHDARIRGASGGNDGGGGGGGGGGARVVTCIGHKKEVCGLRWSTDGMTLASGGNDHSLCLWDAAMSGASARGPGASERGANEHRVPRLTLTQHRAAVKALAWCPFRRNLLASGGGKADRTIKLWDASSGTVLRSVETGSQVCSLLWSKHEKELVSSHGFSQNQLCLWHYPTMTKVGGRHEQNQARPLHLPGATAPSVGRTRARTHRYRERMALLDYRRRGRRRACDPRKVTHRAPRRRFPSSRATRAACCIWTSRPTARPSSRLGATRRSASGRSSARRRRRAGARRASTTAAAASRQAAAAAASAIRSAKR